MKYSTRPNIVTLTQAQYDALSLEDKNNGTIYMVSDAAALSQSIPCITLTQAQYDALSTAEKNNGTVYFIIDGAGEGGGPYVYITGTLTAGSTSITLLNACITSASYIEVFASNGNINYTSISVETGSVTIGFLAQSSDITVTVRIS